SFVFGGFKILKAKLEWESAKDARIIYYIFEEGKNGEKDKKIGEVTDGKSSFEIDKFMLFQTKNYYVVPYDLLSEVTGDPSNTVKMSFYDISFIKPKIPAMEIYFACFFIV